MKSEVIINNIHVDLSDDFSITIEKNSQLTQFSQLIDTWAYNLTFPRTETNEAAFEHVERFEKKFIGWQEYPFQFLFNGRLILNGKIKAKFRGGKYEGYAFGMFGSMASSMASRNLSKKVNSLTFPEITFTNKAAYTPGTDPYCLFEIYNPYYYKGRGIEIDVTAGETDDSAYKEWMETQYGKQNRFDIGTNLFIKPALLAEYMAVITPFMFAGYMVEKILLNFGIKTTSNILSTDATLKQACIYTNFDITKISQTGWSVYAPSGGDWQTGSGIVVKTNRTLKTVSTFNPANLLPETWSINDFLTGLQNVLNVIVSFSDRESSASIIDREVIFNGAATDINHKLLSSPELDIDNGKQVILEFGIDENDLIWKNNYKKLDDDQRSRIQGEIPTLAILLLLTDMSLGDIYYVTADHQYREYRKETQEVDVGGITELHEVLTWYFLSIDGQPLYSGTQNEDEVKIESKFGMVSGWPGSNYMLLMGNSQEFADKPQDFSPRIMFYRGLIGGIPNGDTYGGDIDASWKGENGLFEKRWKHTVKAIREGIKGVAYFDFDEVDFSELNLNKKFRIDEGTFIIEKSTTTFTLNDIKPTEANILKLP